MILSKPLQPTSPRTHATPKTSRNPKKPVQIHTTTFNNEREQQTLLGKIDKQTMDACTTQVKPREKLFYYNKLISYARVSWYRPPLCDGCEHAGAEERTGTYAAKNSRIVGFTHTSCNTARNSIKPLWCQIYRLYSVIMHCGLIILLNENKIAFFSLM